MAALFALAWSAAPLFAQRIPTERRAAKKRAARVWTNDDFPERPAPAPAAKTEAGKPATGEAGPEKPATAADKPAETERQLADLRLAAQRSLDENEASQATMLEEVNTLKAQRDAETNAERQLRLTEQILLKQKEIVQAMSRISSLRREIEQIDEKLTKLKEQPGDSKAAEEKPAEPKPPQP